MAYAPVRTDARPPSLDQTDTAYEARRRVEKPWRNWYKLAVWVKDLRPAQLARQPLCEMCLDDEDVTPATVVNHKTPHGGDWELFTDPDNHQSLCKQHHDIDAQRADRAYRRRVGGGAISGR